MRAMGWIIQVLMSLFYGVQGYEQSKRAGTWSWSKFFFTLAFAAVEILVLCSPFIFLNQNNPAFWPFYIAAWVVAAVLFVLFIIKARRWKMPDGRTSLEADRDARRQGQ
jgi:Ca2+/Na+ antiporter